MWKLLLLTTVFALISGGWASAAEPLRVLYLTKSAGFPHSVVNREGDAPAYSEKALMEIAKKQQWDLVCSKDASLINAENLKNYDVGWSFIPRAISPRRGPMAPRRWVRTGAPNCWTGSRPAGGS